MNDILTLNKPLVFLIGLISYGATWAGDFFDPSDKKKLSSSTSAALLSSDQAVSNGVNDKNHIAEIEMFVGETRVLPAPNIGRIAVGNGKVMSAAAIDNKEVIIFANAPGTSSLFVWNKEGRYQRVKINIFSSDTPRIQKEVAGFLQRIDKVSTSVVGDKVIVEGDNLSDADQEKVAELAKRYDQVVNFTGRLGWERMVLMDVRVVELPTTFLRSVGVRWANSTEGGLNSALNWDLSSGRKIEQRPGQQAVAIPFPNKSLSGFIGLNATLSSQIDLLEQQGQAVTLAQPQLSARSGSTASFLAGGEIPYQVVTKDGASIQFKPYGVSLTIKPRVDQTGSVRSSIEMEVSSVDASITSNYGPALRTRKTTTDFNLKAGETFVLSGFLSRDQSTDINKVPGLGDLPVLGALFRSKRYQQRETELVVLVTPSIVSAANPDIKKRIESTEQILKTSFSSDPKIINEVKTEVIKDKPLLPALNQPQISLPVVTGLAASFGIFPERTDKSPTEKLKMLSATQKRRVNLAGLVIRKDPNINSPILLRLNLGQLVDTDISSEATSLGGWRRVSVGDVTGWAADKWLISLK